METVEWEGEHYPKFQSEGFAAQFAFPFAYKFCKGYGLDVGYGREEWKLPGAIGIDQNKIMINDRVEEKSVFSALNLPFQQADGGGWNYIFSSHCLEHIPNWVDVLNHWYDNLRQGGILFLYLPDFSQRYWRPWNNRKHIHAFTPEIIEEYMLTKFKNVIVSGVDLNSSFIAVGEK